jgi:hypothetical protein
MHRMRSVVRIISRKIPHLTTPRRRHNHEGIWAVVVISLWLPWLPLWISEVVNSMVHLREGNRT